MIFKQETIDEMKTDVQSLTRRYHDLLAAYAKHGLKNPRAREFAVHGYPRRLSVMIQCIENVFTLIPPDSEEIPARETRTDALVSIQAFVINVFGALDNLAWIWVQEKGITKHDGTALPDEWIGMHSKNTAVRSTFSKELQCYLKCQNEWFAYLVNFRHSLAHRIPLYIPPYVIEKKNQGAYGKLEVRKAEAAQRGDAEAYERISMEQSKLTTFKPWIQHSYGEGSKLVVFHPQMIRDFATVEQLGWKMLEELKRDLPPPEVRASAGRLRRLFSCLCAALRGN
jgi:hypothetical protein